jgi:hypothetical protein
MNDAFKGIEEGTVDNDPAFKAKKKVVMKRFDDQEKKLKQDKLEWEVKQEKKESEFAQSLL